MTGALTISDNLLCGDIPTEVAAISGNFDGYITEGNYIGSSCDVIYSEATSKVASEWWPWAVAAMGVLALVGAYVAHARRQVIAATTANRLLDGDGASQASLDNSASSATLGQRLLDEDGENQFLEMGSVTIVSDTASTGSSATYGGLVSEPMYNAYIESWETSNAQLAVFDEELRVVSWSTGMAEVAAGFKPERGMSLGMLPFPTAKHHKQVAEALTSIMCKGNVPVHPEEALVAALHTKPNLVFHIRVLQREVVLRVTAIRMYAPRKDGAWHVLVMGHEQVDASLASLVCAPTTESISDLTSDTGGGLSHSEIEEDFPVQNLNATLLNTLINTAVGLDGVLARVPSLLSDNSTETISPSEPESQGNRANTRLTWSPRPGSVEPEEPGSSGDNGSSNGEGSSSGFRSSVSGSTNDSGGGSSGGFGFGGSGDGFGGGGSNSGRGGDHSGSSSRSGSSDRSGGSGSRRRHDRGYEGSDDSSASHSDVYLKMLAHGRAGHGDEPLV